VGSLNSGVLIRSQMTFCVRLIFTRQESARSTAVFVPAGAGQAENLRLDQLDARNFRSVMSRRLLTDCPVERNYPRCIAERASCGPSRVIIDGPLLLVPKFWQQLILFFAQTGEMACPRAKWESERKGRDGNSLSDCKLKQTIKRKENSRFHSCSKHRYASISDNFLLR
jgi:hypothetical protein